MKLALTRWFWNPKKIGPPASSLSARSLFGNEELRPPKDAVPSQLAELTDLFREGEQARKAGDKDAALHLYGEALALGDGISTEAASSATCCRDASETYAQLGRRSPRS